ncbi:tripartite tricarboxylate transporter substrate binding protein [Desmospora activa]|uniref:Tripartite-type tricarboxylate transporter receptor subunit TctC n=1 Tax=Desmospora activa DSM 45169 TaxID=1121389 RepID=A0A2T4ZC72_9BACL|nr:tripartite tricarboxylate transporter substrate binding protein [Desmospora activa]PTM59491.1 tripartite-type tricarboxylate transporter receptor subunit TctC [Desmospora activa DSM 45169]
MYRSLKWIFSIVAIMVLTACNQTVDGGGNYPSKPIHYVIPFDAGGQSDIEARRQQPLLRDTLGQEIIIEYRPGGGGAIGWSELAQKKPDGTYIAGINLPHIILQPIAQKDAGYQTEQLKTVAIFQATPIGLAVPKESNLQTIEDFIAAAQKQPGKITIAGSGTYSGHHLAYQQLQNSADINLQYISFTGAATQVQAFLGGNTTAILANSDDLVKHKDRLRILAIGSEERFEPLPDVPTFKEAGLNITASIDRGVAVPADTPQAIVQTLESAFLKIADDSKVQQQMKAEGFEPKSLDARESESYIKEKTLEYQSLLRELGVVAD